MKKKMVKHFVHAPLHLNPTVFPIAADVVKAIQEADNLETLILSGNTCGVEACKAIGTALNDKPTFKVPNCTRAPCAPLLLPPTESNVEGHIYR